MDKKSSTTRFLLVKHDCGAEQVIFDQTKTEVKCSSCSGVIAKPTGGQADVFGKVVKVVSR